MAQILSDIITLKRTQNLNSAEIEAQLSQKYGEIIRWAIVEAGEDFLKISLSYIS